MIDLRLLQTRVSRSATTDQNNTSLEHRAIFLATEAGEVLKAVLEHRAFYGHDRMLAARARIGHELCDLIWNACELATTLGIDLQPNMDKLLKMNPDRKWGDDA